MNHLKGLREFVEALSSIGEVQPIDCEVDWNPEIGAVTRRSYELRAPAPLFRNIKDIAAGFRVLGAPGGLSANALRKYARVALALGFDPNTPARKIVEALAAAQSRPGLPPRWMDAGPCKQNKMIGREVDLFKFPTPLIHGTDGGRYIQTFGMNIVRRPDRKCTTGW